jgi:DNA-binding MarR family transcriptional regulator
MAQETSHTAAMQRALGGVGPLARRLHQAHTRLWHENVHSELTGPQYTVLSLLHLRGEMDQSTIGALASLDKSTAAPLLARLEQRGLVDITTSTEDRRRKVVSITEDGHELIVRLASAAAGVADRMLAAFTTEEATQFLSLLQRAISSTSPGDPSRSPLTSG